MTTAIISSRLVPNTHPSTLYVSPSRTDWDILFQPLFDELLNPPPSIDPLAPEVIATNAEVIASRTCPRGISLTQSKYALESLKKYGMEASDPVDTPLVEKSKLDKDLQGKAVDL
ncbi:hypothetical protein Tco_1127691, partial [Tanacetum coccineum]